MRRKSKTPVLLANSAVGAGNLIRILEIAYSHEPLIMNQLCEPRPLT